MPLWITAIQWVSRSVLGLLVLLSVWSVASMIRSSRLLKKADGLPGTAGNELDDLSRWIEAGEQGAMRDWAATTEALHGGTVRTMLAAKTSDPVRIDRAVRSYLSTERSRLEQGLTVLATLGANAPFIGLFGTVLGIIQAFAALGAHQNNASDIMVGIAEALIATAVGLFVAIPAVVAYNVFTRKLKVLMVRSEAIKDLYLSRIQGS